MRHSERGGRIGNERLHEAGAVDVLFKPIDEEELVSAIEKALETRH